MRITYDPEADAAYIYLTEDPLTSGRDSLPVQDVLATHGAMVAMDWKNGKLVGLEVLDASRLLHADLLATAVRPGQR